MTRAKPPLRALLLRDFVKRTLRYPKSSFDMGKCSTGALLARIPKGLLGEDTSKLLGSLVLAQVRQAATARATVPADARNKLYFSEAPEDARILARHILPELDEHDLTHLDAYTAAARLVVAGRRTPAFTMRTRPGFCACAEPYRSPDGHESVHNRAVGSAGRNA